MKKKQLITISGAVALLIVMLVAWNVWFSPTNIAFINYQVISLGQISKANDNSFIKIKELTVDDIDKVSRYDMVFINAMGLKITEAQRAVIQAAADKGTPIFSTGITNPANNICSIDSLQRATIMPYLSNGGRRNYRSLLNYVRKYVDKKIFMAREPEDVQKSPNDPFYHTNVEHPDEDNLGFNTIAAYNDYLKKIGVYDENKPRIIVTGQMGVGTDLVDGLEAAGDMAYGVRDISSLVKSGQIDSIAPNAIINMAHGRMGDYIVEYLTKTNIPLFCPLNVNRLVEDWQNDKMGMSGGFLSQSVVTPEIDGAIRPFALFGHYLDEEGLQHAYAIPDRLETFVATVNNYIKLQQKSNADKKVAIYYYKGPGQNAMAAAGLEVAPSLFNLLKYLKQEGFTVNGLPATSKELEAMIQQQGAVFNNYAEGAFDEFMANGNPALVSKEEFNTWAQKALPADLLQEVVELNGEFPGAYMTTEEGKLGVARLQFGNVVLLPQNAAGAGENSFKVVHGTNMAPPYTYIASYLWTQYGFGADAMIHFGTHGSLEFTPRKQVALCSYDWPDRLVGALPHFYIYSIADVGEGVIAKRRSYAGLQSHLTPPFLESNVRGMYKELMDKIKIYNSRLADLADDPQGEKLINEASLAVKAVAVKMGMHRELEMDSILTQPWSEEDVARIENFAEELATEKITGQLYTLGIPYEDIRITSSVYAMSTDPIAYSMLALDKLRGKASMETEKHKTRFTQLYLNPARDIVTRVLANPALVTDAYICSVMGISQEELDKARKIDQERNAPSGMMAMMMAMGSSQGTPSNMPQAMVGFTKETGADMDKKPAADAPQAAPSAPAQPAAQPAPQGQKPAPMGGEAPAPQGEKPQMRPEAPAPAAGDTLKPRHHGEGAMPQHNGGQHGGPMGGHGGGNMQGGRPGGMGGHGGMGSGGGELPDFVKQMLAGKSDEEIRELVKGMGMPETAVESILAQIRGTKAESTPAEEKPAAPAEVAAQPAEQVLAAAQAEAPQAPAQAQPAQKPAAPQAAPAPQHTPNKGNQPAPQGEAKPQGGGMGGMMRGMMGKKEEYSKEEINLALAIIEVERTIKNINNYRTQLKASPDIEMQSLVNAMSGGYVKPSPGGDIIANPNTLPTGRNLYGINAEATPSEAAWDKGVRLANSTIEMYKKRHNDSIPRKVSYTLWSGEFIETEGATIAQILYMLGVEPIRDAFGRVSDIRLIPSEELGRPRIDVVVQTSGQLRDIAASRLFLINRAVEMAAAANDDKYENQVAEGVVEAERTLIEKGLTPKDAREISTFRVFGAQNGGYGTGIQGMVMSGDRWEDEKEIAEVYLNNMGAYYGSEKNWETFKQFAFEAALTRTDAVIQPRQSNTWGALSLDHVYEFMGGLNLTVRNVTGKDPDAYLSDYRNRNNVRMQEVKEAIGVESRTTIFNPTYIKEKMKGEASSAGTFAEIIQNTYAWNVMKPKAIDNEMWDEIYNVYVKDKFNLDVQKFFEEQNPAALEEMTAVMLETVRKGMWKASEQQIADIAKLHTDLVNKYKPSCSGFVCDNAKLREFIAKNTDPQAAAQYKQNINEIRESRTNADKKGVVMKKEELNGAESETNVLSNSIAAVVVIVVIAVLIFVVRQRRKKGQQ